jgi:hypothetical protein
MQIGELSLNPQQEKAKREIGAEKILPKMPEAHSPQGVEIDFGWRVTRA